MSSKIYSAAVIGLDCEVVEVEADMGGMPDKFIIVGLPDKSVEEARERVKAAIKNSGLYFTRPGIIINLAPADLKKQGPIYDLPIAVSLLADGKKIHGEQWRDSLFIGELALDGSLRTVNGVLSIALMAKAKGFKKIFLPCVNAHEAGMVDGFDIFPIINLRELADHLSGLKRILPFDRAQSKFEPEIIDSRYDMAHIKGQERVKRAMEIAAAGAHNMLFNGPPGSGKTLLARTMSTILPSMSLEEELEVTRIYSVAGLLPNNKPLMKDRPFRSPHHTASNIALIGGGTWPKPGEISLAHRGVLFLDEFPEFPRSVLESLRQPLEDGNVFISRAASTLSFPAKFVLIAAQNPCPCGYATDPVRRCTCSPHQIIQYQKKISGPLLDRIDLCIEVPRLEFDKLNADGMSESSAVMRARVEEARQRQTRRFVNSKALSNAEMSVQEIKEYCKVDDKTQDILRSAVTQLHLSARAYHRILKLGRTIADLAGEDNILSAHICEALQYRPKAD